MPYIESKSDRRQKLRNGNPAQIAGELNYQIFYFIKHNFAIKDNVIYGQIKAYVDNFLGKNPNYQRYNDMAGCLLLCGKEINRRLGIYTKHILNRIMDSYDGEIANYENLKIISNGDVED